MTRRRSLAALRREAGAAAHWRGHRLRWTTTREPARVATGECTRCPAWVQVMTDPPANGVDIGGPAVAINCPAT